MTELELRQQIHQWTCMLHVAKRHGGEGIIRDSILEDGTRIYLSVLEDMVLLPSERNQFATMESDNERGL